MVTIVITNKHIHFSTLPHQLPLFVVFSSKKYTTKFTTNNTRNCNSGVFRHNSGVFRHNSGVFRHNFQKV